jgi:monofunctional biosynthetic peptidoglycan transglycosylase
MSLLALPWLILVRRWVIRILLGFISLSLFLVLLFKWLNPTWTLTMLSRKMANDKAEFHIEKEWKNLNEISRNLQLAVICSEDQHFCIHHGFDFAAIKNAMESNAKGGPVRGASTISQQTAKNVFLWESRSWVRKGLEAWFTLLIELIWGKERIMEVYLNIAETGEGLFGAESAAKKYFGVSASKLNIYQAAGIASILPNPRRWRIGGYPAAGRQGLIIYAMTHYGIQLEYLK